MPKEPKTNGSEPMDEIDKFLSTLPSLRITDDMLDDPDAPVTSRGASSTPVTLPSIFALVAWVVAVFSLLTVFKASPQSNSFFNNLLDRHNIVRWEYGLLFNAMCYMLGNCFVCIGGLVICLVKKTRMVSGAALSLWIAGGLSAVAAIVLQAFQ